MASSSPNTNPQSTNGYIYFLKAETGQYKIGKSKRPVKRASTLGLQLPFKSEVIHLIAAEDYSAAEKLLHAQLKSYQVNGEWFNPPPEIIERYLGWQFLDRDLRALRNGIPIRTTLDSDGQAETSTPRSDSLTPKARRTREHILTTALALFAEKGYGETTLRDIAGAAGVSLGLAYRYFARKEELILALYQRLAGELEEEVRAMPPAPMAERFAGAVGSCLRRLGSHRDALGALFAVGLAPDSEMAVLGESAAGVRDVVWRVYHEVVRGASDKPRPRQEEQIATLFYAAHLLFVLFWLQDRTPGQRATAELIGFAEEMLGRLRPVLGLPPVARPLTRLARILAPMFGPPERT